MEVRRLPESELYHHGEKGQKWGVMHGPPYPLDDNASVQAKKKKKSLMTRIKDKRKGKMLQKAKAKKKAERAERERIINSGDVNEVRRVSKSLTNEELQRALDRIEMSSKLSDYSSNGKGSTTKKTGMDYVANIDKTMKMISSVAGAGKSIIELTNAIEGKKKKKEN